jgi:hypothetical protein
VDFVLDNAGFELFTDLAFAGYLLETGLATQVVMHPKDIPWFISDVIAKDLEVLMNAISNPMEFYTESDFASEQGLAEFEFLSKN